jgi:hypothetical protein
MTQSLPFASLLFRRLARSIAFVAGGLLFGQKGGLALSFLGCGPCRQFGGFPFSLCGTFGGTGRLFGQLGFMRLLRGFTLGGARGSFCEHGLSCRPTLNDGRIIRPGCRPEFLQHGFFRLHRVVLPLPKIGEQFLVHL